MHPRQNPKQHLDWFHIVKNDIQLQPSAVTMECVFESLSRKQKLNNKEQTTKQEPV